MKTTKIYLTDADGKRRLINTINPLTGGGFHSIKHSSLTNAKEQLRVAKIIRQRWLDNGYAKKVEIIQEDLR